MCYLISRGNLSQSLRLIKLKLPARWGNRIHPIEGVVSGTRWTFSTCGRYSKLAMIIMTIAILGILFAKKLLFMPHTLNFLQC